MGSIIDVTSQVNLEEHLKLSEKRYESFFYYNTDMIYDIDLNGTIIAMNPACQRVAGYQPDEVIGQSFVSFIVDEHIDKTMYHFSEALNGVPQQFDITIWDKDGKRVDLSCSSIPIIVNEEVIGVYGIGKDITKIKRAEEQATFLANYDPLTNLPNRRLFENRFSEISTNKKVAVMFTDIDHFKQVNDSFGHKIGDQLIQLVATRLKNQVRDADTVARLGGDEFTILLPNIKDDKEPLEIAERIIKTMTTPFIIDGVDLTTTSSIGITISTANLDYQTLIQQADIAMYKAKSYGRNGYALYSKEMDEH
nr:diguanylate cyclase [Bacillus mesophilus]